MRPRVYSTEAIVLKQTPVGEADRILTLYTPSRGKTRVLAKGVRRPQSKLAGHVEPLTHTSLLVAQGRSLDLVTQAQTLYSFLPIRQDLQRLSKALYIAELVDHFSPEEAPNVLLYQLFLETLYWLEEAQGDLPLRYFQVRLLDLSGYRPEVHQCVSCGSRLTPQGHRFRPLAGGVVCPRCATTDEYEVPISLSGLKVLRFLQKETYPGVKRLHLPHPLSRQVGEVLETYIRHLLGKEVKAESLLREAAPTYPLEALTPEKG